MSTENLRTIKNISDEYPLPSDAGNRTQPWGFRASASPFPPQPLRGQGKVISGASGGVASTHSAHSQEKLNPFSSGCGESAWGGEADTKGVKL